ncbi:MAG: C39 family peptidase [Minisyncoccota bacterium]
MLYANLLINLLISTSIAASGTSLSASINTPSKAIVDIQASVPSVPFYSQFRDISSVEWQKLSCGIASLAMLIEFYKPGVVETNTLLKEGVAAGAYLKDAGWKHDGLVLLAGKYGLKSASYDLANLSMNNAFIQFEKYLKEGPVIVSVHYKLDPKNPIPHLIVVNGINNDLIYYNDPAETLAGEKISVQDFIKAWKKRFIVVRS